MATNLEFIKSAEVERAINSGVTSLSVTDCFSDRYDVYMIRVSNLDLGNSTHLYMRLLDSANAEISANEYDNAQRQLQASSSSTDSKNTADTEFQYAGSYAADGDGDRNMILGTKFFVSPSDFFSYDFTNIISIFLSATLSLTKWYRVSTCLVLLAVVLFSAI